MGGAILYTDSTHIKAKANKHKKKLVMVEETPKAYLEELDAQVDRDREVLKKKPFDRDDDPPGGSTTTKMESTTDPESGQQNREGKPEGFYYSDHRTVDSKRNVIVNVHIEPANVNDTTPLPKILDEIEGRLGKLPKYMGLDAGYHYAWVARHLEKKGIQAVIGYRRHTHKTETPFFIAIPISNPPSQNGGFVSGLKEPEVPWILHLLPRFWPVLVLLASYLPTLF